MPTDIRFARIVLASTLAAVSCGVISVLAEPDSGSRASTTTSIAADAANGLPTGKRTYHSQLIALSDAPPPLLPALVPGGATTAQFAGGRQPTPPQPV